MTNFLYFLSHRRMERTWEMIYIYQGRGQGYKSGNIKRIFGHTFDFSEDLLLPPPLIILPLNLEKSRAPSG